MVIYKNNIRLFIRSENPVDNISIKFLCCIYVTIYAHSGKYFYFLLMKLPDKLNIFFIFNYVFYSFNIQIGIFYILKSHSLTVFYTGQLRTCSSHRIDHPLLFFHYQNIIYTFHAGFTEPYILIISRHVFLPVQIIRFKPQTAAKFIT